VPLIRAILHINIGVARACLEECRDFYCDVLGLKVGARPPFASVGYWLYAGGEPLIHLVVAESAQPGTGPGFSALRHVAFECSDLPAALARLQARGVAYTMSRVPGLDMAQVNFKDPAGVGIELSCDSPPGTTSQ
jgi:catechol 2,3-dioxygenase-like lactoylglutathione lyase family enzyme